MRRPEWKTFERAMWALLSGSAAIGLAGCQKQAAPPAFERPPANVAVAAAITKDVPIFLDEVGKCAARETVTVQPQVAGRITEIHFTDGSDLKKGDPLFTIDPRPFQAVLDAAQATLAQRKAALDLAKIDYARVADLVDSKAIARQDYDAKKNAVDVAAAQVSQSEAEIETAKLNLDYTVIRSPIDGRAGQRLVDVGNVVATSNSPLLVIQRLDPIYADFSIAEGELSTVQQNMARNSLRVEVQLPDDSGPPRTGTITFLDNLVQDSSGTVKLRATIANSDHHFWPGRFVKIRLILSTLSGAVLIPSAATQMSANGPFVYVVKQDSTAEMRQVTLGQRQGDLVIVSSGISSGEQVITTGQMAVMPGGKVHVEQPQGTARDATQDSSQKPAQDQAKPPAAAPARGGAGGGGGAKT